MTTTAPPVTGQDINLAARFTRLALTVDLAAIDLSFEQSVVMNLVVSGSTVTSRDVRNRLSAALGLQAAEADEVLEHLEAAQLLDRQEDGLALTPAGRLRWHEAQAAVAALVAELYADLDPDELAATRRVLVAVTERAQRRLAGSRASKPDLRSERSSEGRPGGRERGIRGAHVAENARTGAPT